MIRLGFWPSRGQVPEDPADEIRRMGEIGREIAELNRENRHLYNEQALIKEMRKRRLAESRQKQKETRERRERERQQRAEEWRNRKEREIVYLGEGVSAGLGDGAANEERLREYGLPILSDAEEIARAMGTTVGELRFLAFSRQTSTSSHYIRFKVPKKTGGHRMISAPKPRLKAAQHWILRNILEKVEAHSSAHGFYGGRSIVSNARPHVGAEAVINVDLKDFFPTISYRRVKGVFRALGFSEAAATIFALVCTEPDVEEVELDGKTYYVALTDRHLPQGAPTSPAITNILCRRLDRRLASMADEFGFTYTRYADDLTFSASGDDLRNVCNVRGHIEDIVAHEGFAVHPEKTRVLRKSRRQEVTGVVVNSKPNISRKTLRQFRATLYQIEKDGPEGKRWGQSDDVIASIQGFANFVFMVHPEKGAEFQGRVRAIMDKYGWQPRKVERRTTSNLPKGRPETGAAESVADSDKETETSKKWWKLW